jgi:succinyl-diaminopimelate desuccinylase
LDFIDLCKKIIFIDSTPSGGTEDVTRFASDLCAGGGMDVTLQEGFLAGKKQFNIIARPKHSFKKHEVVFQTHLDTVEPGPKAAWTETENNPFQATVKNGNIYGLGTADVKLDFLCKWRALKEIAHLKQKFPFALVGTFGEEMGMEGSKLLLSEKAVDAKMAIIGEPSELKIVYANNGYGVCRFEIPFLQEELDFIKNHQNVFSASAQEKIFHGKAVHSSTPHLGENAILKLVDYLSKMPDGL